MEELKTVPEEEPFESTNEMRSVMEISLADDGDPF